MYSPWTTSMPCLFSTSINLKSPEEDQERNSLSYNSNNCLINSFENLDLSNPFNIIATISPSSSIWSLNNFNSYSNQINEDQQQLNSNYFEPLPFLHTQQQINYPQLSQKHSLIKQMIARKHNHNRSQFTSCENLFSSKSRRKTRQICSFCKSNGESANVYTSHILRNTNNEIECPILMSYICPKCGATGKSAHTIKYCPSLSESERVALPTIKLLKEGRSSSGNKNLFKK